MATTLHINEILDQIITELDTNLSFSGDLDNITKGDLSSMPREGDLSGMTPCILLKPVNIDSEIRATGRSFTVINTFRIIYVRKISSGEKIEEERVTEIEEIAELMFYNDNIMALSLSNGQVEKIMPARIELECPEDMYIYSRNNILQATCVDVVVRILTKA